MKKNKDTKEVQIEKLHNRKQSKHSHYHPGFKDGSERFSATQKRVRYSLRASSCSHVTIYPRVYVISHKVSNFKLKRNHSNNHHKSRVIMHNWRVD